MKKLKKRLSQMAPAPTLRRAERVTRRLASEYKRAKIRSVAPRSSKQKKKK